MRITSFPNEQLQAELDNDCWGVLCEHGLEADKMVTSGGRREEDTIAWLALLADDRVAVGVLDKLMSHMKAEEKVLGQSPEFARGRLHGHCCASSS